MIVTTPMTSKVKRNIRREKDKFNYDEFVKDLIEFKERNSYTFVDIFLETRVSMSMITKLFNNKYHSDISINIVCILCEWMNREITKYITR